MNWGLRSAGVLLSVLLLSGCPGASGVRKPASSNFERAPEAVSAVDPATSQQMIEKIDAFDQGAMDSPACADEGSAVAKVGESSSAVEDSPAVPEDSVQALAPSLVAVSPDPALRIPENLTGFGDRCTIIYSRHGEKQKNAKQELTERGHAQARDLAQALSRYESVYQQEIDLVMHSSLARSRQTADPFMKQRPNVTVLDSSQRPLLDECDTSEVRNGVCAKKARRLLELIQGSCKKREDGRPSTLFIAAHGSLGLYLLKEMTGKTCHMDFARPHVITNSGEGFKLLHGPSCR